MVALFFVILFGLVALVALMVALFSEDDRVGAIVTTIIAGILSLVALVVGAFTVVPVGNVAVMVRFGQPTGELLDNGFHWKVLIDDPVNLSIRTQKYEVDCEAASRDLQDVETKVALNYKLDTSKAVQVYTTVGIDYLAVIAQPAIQEVVKAVSARYNAEDMILRREEVRVAIFDALRERLSQRGIVAEALNITNFTFSIEFTKAIEAKVVAVQAVMEAENKLNRVEVEARQAEQKAKGEASARIAEAEGQAKSIAIVTAAQVKANNDIKATLTDEVIKYIFIDRLGKDIKVFVVPSDLNFVLPEVK